MIALTNLRVEQMERPIGLWTRHPRFSWWIDAGEETGLIQTAYELEIEHAGGAAWRTGRIESRDSVLVTVEGFSARSATAYRWRVRCWMNAATEPTAWAESSFETSLLDAGDWRARWIEPRQLPVRPDGAATFAELFSLRIDTPPRGAPPSHPLSPPTVPCGGATGPRAAVRDGSRHLPRGDQRGAGVG